MRRSRLFILDVLFFFLSVCMVTGCYEDPSIEDQATGTEERPNEFPYGPDEPQTPAAPVGTLFSARNGDGVKLQYIVTGTDECELRKDRYEGHLTIPATVNYNDRVYKVTSIERLAFADNSLANYYTGITSISIPATVKHIGSGVFSGCKLETTEFESVESMCLMEYDDANSSPMKFSERLLINGETVTDIVIPSSVSKIGKYAFNNCGSITSLKFSDSVNQIEEQAFFGCRQLASVSLPEGLSSISAYCFGNCVSLAEVYIPESVTCIEERAFGGCSELKTVIIPKNVTTIGDGAFRCYNQPHERVLTALTMESETPPTCEGQPFDDDWEEMSIVGRLRVPVGSKEAYLQHSTFRRFRIIEEYAKGEEVFVFDQEADNDLLVGIWEYQHPRLGESYTFTKNNRRVYKNGYPLNCSYSFNRLEQDITFKYDNGNVSGISLLFFCPTSFTTNDYISYNKISNVSGMKEDESQIQ